MWWRLVVLAFRNLWRRKGRSLLLLQGVIWGTALGVLPPAIIHGSTGKAHSQAAELGMDRLLLRQDQPERPLDWLIVEELRDRLRGRIDHLTGYALLAPEDGPLQLVCDAEALAARRMELARGRFLTPEDVTTGARVCVLEALAAERYFGGRDPIGQSLDLGASRSAEVVGVTAARAASGEALDEFGYEQDHALRGLVEAVREYSGVVDDGQFDWLIQDSLVMVPYTVYDGVRPGWIELRAEPERLLDLRDELRADFIGRGFEPMIYVNAILPVLFGESLQMMVELNRIVFALCILVGTAIVCVVMVLTVLERRHEIAIRRTEGARTHHIALQFIVETGTICMVGGVVGVPLGLLLAALRCAVEPLDAVSFTLPVVEASVMVAVVTLTGLLGGVLPAYRATRIDPVEVLRTE